MSASGNLLEAPAPAFSAERAAELAHEIFGIRGTALPLGSERDQNFRIRPASGPEYVLKIPNQAEDASILELQQSALAHVADVAPELSVPRLHPTLDGALFRDVEGPGGGIHSVWLLSYLPGDPWSEVKPTALLYRNLGTAIAQLARALRGFFHPAAGRELLWDLKHTPQLRPRLSDIANPTKRRLAESVLDAFDRRARRQLPGLRAQIIHSDANSGNVIVDRRQPERVAGFIDFGDIVHSALINDLGIALASTIEEPDSPIEAACQVVAGYHEITPLVPDELGLIFDLWRSRLAAEVIIAAWRSKSHPENVDYIAGSTDESWSMLERLQRLESNSVGRAFLAACELDASSEGGSH